MEVLQLPLCEGPDRNETAGDYLFFRSLLSKGHDTDVLYIKDGMLKTALLGFNESGEAAFHHGNVANVSFLKQLIANESLQGKQSLKGGAK